MTTPRPADPLDDDAIGAIVRDVAGQWTMPAVRLDAPGWRERVRTPRARRTAALRGGLARLGQAAGAALALTVAAALLGVYLSNHDAGKAAPSDGTTPRPTVRPLPSAVAAAPLPKVFVGSQLAGPTRLLVSDEGVFEMLDLTTGALAGHVGNGQFGSRAWATPDGGITCVCVTGDGYSRAGEAVMTVSLLRYDASGTLLSTTSLASYRGTSDPRDPLSTQFEQQASAVVSDGPVPGTAAIDWVAHAHPVWHSGIDVVDLATGHVSQRLALPDRSDGEGNVRVAPTAVTAIGSTGDGRLLIVQPWDSWSPPAATNPDFTFATDVFAARLSDGMLSDVQPYDPGRQCGSVVIAAGPRPDGAGTWLACASDTSAQTRLRLVDADGAVTDVQVPAAIGGSEGSAFEASPDGRWLYLWDASSLRLTRVSLADGTSSAATGTTAALDPWTALGRWLVPSAAAKVILSPGLAIAPDGSRVYALGVDMSTIGHEGFAGSTGIFVFDTTAMTQVGRWTPTADFVSVAVNADGSQVYAAGAPMYGADGLTTNQPASVTVYDAGTGQVRAISGSLGQGFLTFPDSAVR